jgi:type I restriction enzyme S subunit
MGNKWPLKTIGSIAEVIGGGTPSTAITDYWGGKIIWLTPTEVVSRDGGVITDSERHLTLAGLGNSGAQLLPPDTVMLTTRASVGYTAIAGVELCTNQGFQSLIPNRDILSKFLMFWIQANRHEFESRAAGSTFKEISKANVKSLKILLPSLEEQRRIVDLVSSVDLYIFALQQQADAARVARNAVLSELLSAGGEDWIETTLGEVAELNPEATKNFPADQVIRYIDLASVSHETGISQDLTEVKYGDAPGRARRVVRVADVLVSTVRPYLKGFALVPKDLDGGVASTGFAVVRAKPDKTLPGFIWAFVGLEPFVLHLMDRATGSNYPAVRPEDIASFKLMLPPIAEQKRIVDLVSSMDDMIKTTHHAVSNATRMRSGLLSDLLSGKHEIPESYDRLLGAA